MPEIVLFYTLTKIEQNDKIELEELLISKLSKKTGEKLMTSLARHWEEEGIAKGRAEGIAKGKAELIKMMLKNGNTAQSIAKSIGMSETEIVRLANTSSEN